jgi:hypothetical protein
MLDISPIPTNKLGMVVHVCNPRSAMWEAYVGEPWSEADFIEKLETLTEKQPKSKKT